MRMTQELEKDSDHVPNETICQLDHFRLLPLHLVNHVCACSNMGPDTVTSQFISDAFYRSV
jgi:hypothetical protein